MAYVVGVDPAVARGSSPPPPPHGGATPWQPFAAPREPPRSTSLAELVESEIIPRLIVAHGLFPEQREPLPEGLAGRLDVALIAPLAMEVDADALLAHVDTLLDDGLSIDSLLVDLIAPAARHLGVLWEEDRCDFMDVTMGLWRLQEIVREVAARVPAPRHAGGGAHRALFATMPGDQHSFGTVIVEETFRRDGWKTDLALDPSQAELIQAVAAGWFDIVGLTVSCDCNIAPLPSLIHALRSVSRNPRVCIMVGGRVFFDDPVMAITVGADGTAADAQAAVAVAASLVRAVAREVAACG